MPGLVLSVLLGAAANECVDLRGEESALRLRLRDELVATLGRPVSLDGASSCDTVVELDEAAQQVRIVGARVSPPVVVVEPLSAQPEATLAAHLAEAVRAVLLEVEVRERRAPPVVAQEPVASTPSSARHEVGLRVGAAVPTGGLSTAALVAADVVWRFTEVWGVSAHVAGTPLPLSSSVPSGTLRAWPLIGAVSMTVRLALHARLALVLGLGGGAAVVALEGQGAGAFVGRRETTLTPLALADARLVFQLGEHLGLVAGVTTPVLLQRVILTVDAKDTVDVGPVLLMAAGGVEWRF